MRGSQAAPVVAVILVLLPAGPICLLTACRDKSESPTEIGNPPASAPPETQPSEPNAECRFLNDEFLTNPTTNSVTLSVIPATLERIFVEYGPQPGKYTRKTPAKMVEPDTPYAPVLDGLAAGSDYYYRVNCSHGPRQEHTFRTLRAESADFNFAFATDSHIYQGWLVAEKRDNNASLDAFNKTIGNIQAQMSELDFLIIGGDSVQTHCRFCPKWSIDGETLGRKTVQSQREAELRYRVVRRLYEPLTHSLPVLKVLGNHDGEAGFGDAEGSCDHYDTTQKYCTPARLKFAPNCYPTYDGGPDGNYYFFETGDVLIVVLDVMRYTTRMPVSPDDWTLGKIQLAWLDQTLANSSKTWKMVFAEHLVGGEPDVFCYAYGRGSVKATDNNRPTGRFLGEQAIIHDMLQAHNVRLFIYCHDHVFALNEKLNRDGSGQGVWYMCGGRAATRGAEPLWAKRPSFQDAYDYDSDGRPDYITKRGFVKFTVHRRDALEIQYIESNAENPSQNASTIFRAFIDPAGKRLERLP